MKISVMMPCYKEAENLKQILPKISNVLFECETDSEILVVDTMEPMDSTEEICEEIKDSLSAQIRYIHRRKGNNYGDAIRTGFEDALGEYVVVMDADGSHDPNDIAKLYREIKDKNCGVVIGSRYTKGGDTDNPLILKLMSYILNVSYRFFFHLNVKDVSDSYRIYKAAYIKELNLQCDNFDIVEEILIKLRYNHPDMEMREVPIFFNKRAYGESKRDLGRFIWSYLATMRRLKMIQKG